MLRLSPQNTGERETYLRLGSYYPGMSAAILSHPAFAWFFGLGNRTSCAWPKRKDTFQSAALRSLAPLAIAGKDRAL